MNATQHISINARKLTNLIEQMINATCPNITTKALIGRTKDLQISITVTANKDEFCPTANKRNLCIEFGQFNLNWEQVDNLQLQGLMKDANRYRYLRSKSIDDVGVFAGNTGSMEKLLGVPLHDKYLDAAIDLEMRIKP